MYLSGIQKYLMKCSFGEFKSGTKKKKYIHENENVSFPS